MIMNNIKTLTQMYQMNVKIETIKNVPYDGITVLINGTYNIKINEEAKEETYTHELGHIIVDKIANNNPDVMNEIVNILMIGNEEVLADILGNLIYMYEYEICVRDVTYILPDVETIDHIIDLITKNI